MAAMTCPARSAAPVGLRFGASFDGDFISPASRAASDRLSKRALLPKYFCEAASTP